MRFINKREIGKHYEDVAADYLKRKGYKILSRNYRNRCGEIDIIAMRGRTLVYCECKYRSTEYCGEPFSAVDERKQRKICSTALYHYSRYGYSKNLPCRFDVIGIYSDGTVKHLENAFEFHT